MAVIAARGLTQEAWRNQRRSVPPDEPVHLIHGHTPLAAIAPKRVEGRIVRAVDDAMAESRLGMSFGRYE